MPSLIVRPELPQDRPRIEILLDQAFGHDRHSRGVYALRTPGQHVPSLSYVGVDTTAQVQGSLRFWPLNLNGSHEAPGAVLLGPIAIADAHQGQGDGGVLIERGLTDAAALGYGLCFLVTDSPAIYRRYAFTNARPRFELPVDLGAKKSFLLMELQRGALSAWPEGTALSAIGEPGQPAYS